LLAGPQAFRNFSDKVELEKDGKEFAVLHYQSVVNIWGQNTAAVTESRVGAANRDPALLFSEAGGR